MVTSAAASSGSLRSARKSASAPCICSPGPPFIRQPLGLLDYRWASRTGPERSLAPTLDDSVIEGLIRALYDALPDALNEPLAETTLSGNTLGRHGHAPGAAPSQVWFPLAAPPRPPNRAELNRAGQNRTAQHRTEAGNPEPGPGGPSRAEPSRTSLERAASEAGDRPEPAPEPRPYVLGAVPEGLALVTLRSLPTLEVRLPADPGAGRLSARTVLGQGEPCFLRAQSALWSWRTHRQANLDIHAHGPPHPGRDALIEQKLGPVTLLLGCRVTAMTEEPRRWGFTLGSLSGQVLLCHEEFIVEWQPDDTVVFTVHTQQHLAMPNLMFLGPLHSALRRKFRQGYVRNMLELTAD